MTDAYNAAERKQVRAAEKRAKEKGRLRNEVVATLMSHVGGREWMYDLLDSCGIFSTTFTGELGSTGFNEGRRAVGLSFLADLMRAAPDSYVTMMQEANQRELADAARAAKREPESAGTDDATDGGDDEFDR